MAITWIGAIAIGFFVIFESFDIVSYIFGDAVAFLSLIIAPVIHEYIKGIADASGLNYIEGLDDEEELDLNVVGLSIREKEASRILKEIKEGKEPDLSVLETEEEPMETEQPMPDVKPQEDKPMGLMSRGIA